MEQSVGHLWVVVLYVPSFELFQRNGIFCTPNLIKPQLPHFSADYLHALSESQTCIR